MVSPRRKNPWAAQEALHQLAELGYIDAPDGDGAKARATAVEARESHLAQIHFAARRFADSLEMVRSLARRSDDPSYRAREVMCLLSMGSVAEAEPILQELMAKVPHYGLAKMLAGQVALLQGKEEEAERILRELYETEVEMPVLHNQMAGTYLRRGRWTEAAALFRKALEADPDFAEAHDGLGVALRHLGQYEDSVFEHMRAVSLQHDRAQTHINLGISLARSRQYNWAIRAFEVAAELAPAEPYPHRCLARIYRRRIPDREKARRHLLHARDLRRKLGPATPAFRDGV